MYQRSPATVEGLFEKPVQLTAVSVPGQEHRSLGFNGGGDNQHDGCNRTALMNTGIGCLSAGTHEVLLQYHIILSAHWNLSDSVIFVDTLRKSRERKVIYSSDSGHHSSILLSAR